MSQITRMPVMPMTTNSYRKGEKLQAARSFDMTFGTTTLKVDEGTTARVVSKTGEPLEVKFEGINQIVAIPMSDAEKYLKRIVSESHMDEDRGTLQKRILLSESLIRETRFPTKVTEAAGRKIRVTNIDGTFTMRPFSLIPAENLTSLIGKVGEIVLEYFDLGDGKKIYKCNFAEAGRVALKDSEFVFIDSGLAAEAVDRRSLRQPLSEGETDEAYNKGQHHDVLKAHGWKHNPANSYDNSAGSWEQYTHSKHPDHTITLNTKSNYKDPKMGPQDARSWEHEHGSQLMSKGKAHYTLDQHLKHFHASHKSYKEDVNEVETDEAAKLGDHEALAAYGWKHKKIVMGTNVFTHKDHPGHSVEQDVRHPNQWHHYDNAGNVIGGGKAGSMAKHLKKYSGNK